MNPALKAAHDQLLADKPELGHDAQTCVVCLDASTGGASEENPEGGAVSEKTFTQADIDDAIAKAVAAAVEPLQARLSEFEGAAAANQVESKIADVVGPLNTQLAELQTKLDETTVAMQAEKDRADGIVAWLEQETATQAQTAELEARRTARVAEAKEKAGITDEYLAQVTVEGGPTNADRFAAMSDEDWKTALDGWITLRASKGGDSLPPPRKTALVASADEGTDAPPAGESAVRSILKSRVARTADLSTLAK